MLKKEREERQWVFVFLGVFVPLWQKKYGSILSIAQKNTTKTLRLKGSQSWAFQIADGLPRNSGHIFPSVDAWNIGKTLGT